jgi:parvulin-like peptidyl-prolyl isomerase
MQKLMLGICLVALSATFQANAGNPDPGVEQGAIFAQIDDLTITREQFEAIFQSAVRYKYYHGTVPADELEKFRKQVADDIVTQQLVFNQALKEGLQPDRDQINEGVDAFNLKNASDPEWETKREQVIPQLIEKLERQDLIEKMEARVRDVPAPDADAVRQFYLDTPEKFTEPERRWVSVILLKVPPFANEDGWLEAEEEIGLLKQRIESGEDFAALAKQYSGHLSASNGGDLGFLHSGVLESTVQEKIEALEVDQLSEPIRVLEGVTLFRLNGIEAPQLKSYSEVKDRAANLLYLALQDSAWESYVSELRSSANVHVYE